MSKDLEKVEFDALWTQIRETRTQTELAGLMDKVLDDAELKDYKHVQLSYADIHKRLCKDRPHLAEAFKFADLIWFGLAPVNDKRRRQTAKYRQKPIVIDAFQFTGDFDTICDWFAQWHDRNIKNDGPGLTVEAIEVEDYIHLAALVMILEDHEEWVPEGSWIVHEVDGTFHWYHNDHFRQMYELVVPKGPEEDD